jgi:glycosyltransferase involved in cell wall biosynthesis
MRIAFFSTMAGLPWGGSEELWSRAAHELLRRGHEVAFCTQRWRPTPAPLERLIQAGASPRFRTRLRLGRTLRRTLEAMQLLRQRYARWLRKTRPDVVVISFSCHTDDPQIANSCHRLGIPYAILLQAAGEHNWIPSRSVPDFRTAYANAQRCFFVSGQNREIVETNLSLQLPQAEVVDNPFMVPLDVAPAWPSPEPFWKLACVARVHFTSKAQDVLLRALRAPKWRTRPLKVVCWGKDHGSLQHLQELIELYGLQDQVSYGGFAKSISEIWSTHHALVLPSRVEGNALALIEAMICGRVPIVTNVGRAAELIDDNNSGFIAPAATVELVDEALERAWQQRHLWQAMGQRAAAAIRERHSLRPAEDFAERILNLTTPPNLTRKLAA